MNEELYRLIAEKGEVVNFSMGVYENETDKVGTRTAKKAAKKFLEFAKFCEDNGLKLGTGFGEFNGVGPASYISIKEGDKDLVLMLTPHDIIDVESNEEEEDDGSEPQTRND